MPAWWPTVEKFDLSTSIYNAKSCGVPVVKSTNFQRLIQTLHIHLDLDLLPFKKKFIGVLHYIDNILDAWLIDWLID